eukprot:573870_1
MGACVTNVPQEMRVVKRTTESLILNHDDSSDRNLTTFSSLNDGKISNVPSSYETSTPTETQLCCEQRKSTESDRTNLELPPPSTYHCCWTIGCNKNGAQGNGTKHNNVSHLTKMTSLPNDIYIDDIITGNCGSTYLLCNGNHKLFVYGHNLYGSVSMDDHVILSITNVWNSYQSLDKYITALVTTFIGTISSLKQPLKPCYIYNKPIQWVSCGIAAFHKFMLSAKNELYAFGKNGWNQCGAYFDYDNRNTNHCIKIDYFQTRHTTLKQVACALTLSIFLDENGKLYSCGKCIDGGLGLGKMQSWAEDIQPLYTMTHRIVSIACGARHCLALSEAQHVLSWGSSSYGQLGHGNTKSVFEPKLIKCLSRPNMKIMQIGCGAYHNLVLDREGKVYCFGRNDSFECGTGTNEYNVKEPQMNYTLRNINVIEIRCGFEHNVIKTKGYHFYLWGKNGFNQCLVCKEDQHYVKRPTKYKGSIDGISDWLDYKIIDIYPGWRETRIVATKVKRTSYL